MADNDKTQSELDISYHYPPELLELLFDAVPALFRSKQGVIDFFVGAGVPNELLGDWKIKLKQSSGRQPYKTCLLAAPSDSSNPTR
jgi:hypothetical protein